MLRKIDLISLLVEKLDDVLESNTFGMEVH